MSGTKIDEIFKLEERTRILGLLKDREAAREALITYLASSCEVLSVHLLDRLAVSQYLRETSGHVKAVQEADVELVKLGVTQGELDHLSEMIICKCHHFHPQDVKEAVEELLS